MSIDFQAKIHEYLSHAVKDIADLAIHAHNQDHMFGSIVYLLPHSGEVRIVVMLGKREWIYPCNLENQTIDALFLQSIYNAVQMWFLAIKEELSHANQ